MASSSQSGARRRRLGEILIEARVLDQTQLQAALVEQKKWGGKLGRTLVEMGFVDEDSMMRALSRQLNLPVIDLDRVKLPPSITHLLRVDLAERYGVFPIGADAKGRTLQIATADPTNVDALNELGFSTNSKISTAVATGSSIDRAIRRLYYGEQTTATLTATPQRFGVSESTYELQVAESAPRPPPRPPPPAVTEPVRAPVPAARLPPARDPLEELEGAAQRGEVTRLKEQVAELERHSAGQVRALRALVELLIESGLIAREEYLARVNRHD